MVPARRPSSAVQWAAAGLAAACCLAALAWTGRGAGHEELYEWTPHQGKLTSMMLNARPAREQQLAAAAGSIGGEMRASAPRRASAGRSDQAWAQQMLRLGGSYAEDNSRTNLVTAGYSNTHSGYTSAVPEGRQGGGVYAFANLISHGGSSREDKQAGPARTQQLAETAAPAPAARPQAARPGFTPDVREDRARPATKAWGWASHDEHSAKATALAGTASSPPGESAAVSEAADTHEQKAWSWASTAFRRGARQPAPKAAPVAAKAATPAAHAKAPARLADFAMPKKTTGGAEESPRRARLAEARKAIVKLHRASLDYEHRHFTTARRQESRRARALTHKDDELERAANQGAAAEFDEYSAIASLGVPRGAESAAKSERDGWGRRYRHERTAAQEERARADDFRARDPGQRRRHARHRQRDGNEEKDVTEATDEIFSGIEHHDDNRGSEGEDGRGRRGRRGRGRRGGIQTAAQIAAAEESSYQKGFDAGIAAEEKAAREGGAESQARRRAEALKRQQERIKTRKHAQLQAQKRVARQQQLADNTWGDADADFQVDGGNWGPGGGDWA